MIEILETYLKLSDDQHTSLLEFLSKDILIKLENYKLVEDIYINDNVILIKKNTLKVDIVGRIYKIKDNKISINKPNNVNITTRQKDYYIFVKKVTNKNNDRIFYETLLNKLKTID
jgi:hypothetical protein